MGVAATRCLADECCCEDDREVLVSPTELPQPGLGVPALDPALDVFDEFQPEVQGCSKEVEVAMATQLQEAQTSSEILAVALRCHWHNAPELALQAVERLDTDALGKADHDTACDVVHKARFTLLVREYSRATGPGAVGSTGVKRLESLAMRIQRLADDMVDPEENGCGGTPGAISRRDAILLHARVLEMSDLDAGSRDTGGEGLMGVLSR
mmetsp:Transcript_26534/g.60062  ORF Transcript_26534/g.60062 Transcript_26534/m.60062 type:complete len:211 (-) Transcript_26534:46-678(-)